MNPGLSNILRRNTKTATPITTSQRNQLNRCVHYYHNLLLKKKCNPLFKQENIENENLRANSKIKLKRT